MKVRCAHTCVTLSVTLCVRSLTFGAMIVFSDDGGEGHFFSLFASEKLSAMRGILLMVLYLLRFESEVEPSRLDLIWLSGPEKKGGTVNAHIKRFPCLFTSVDLDRGHWEKDLLSSCDCCDMGSEHEVTPTCGVSSTTPQHNRYWNMMPSDDLQESTVLSKTFIKNE